MYKFRVFFALFIMITLLLISTVAVTSTSAQTQEEKRCPGGTLTTSFDTPPAGMANFRTISFDENCNQVIGPVQTVPIDQLPAIAFDPDARNAVLETLSAGITTTRQPIATYHAEQAILDPVNITLNKLYSDVTFSYDGTNVLSYSAGGGTVAHGENSPPSCGTGWYALNGFNNHISGGVGQGHAGFQQHSEFGYLGLFDCSGNIYYNTFNNFPTVYGNGTGTCSFTQNYRTWSLIWHWTSACY